MTDARCERDGAALLAALDEVLAGIGPAAIALSGGVDSMTLAVAAHRARPGSVAMYHAVSAAVPPQATARVRRHAEREGWRLEVFDAGEFDDPAYRANPVDRCFYCKSNLYRTVTARTELPVLSGTNRDDLGDYRPGLAAAVEHAVRHPFVEAGIDKAGVRAIARHLGLADLAELPAAPCLASRIETGIPIESGMLRLVNDIELMVAGRLGAAGCVPRDVRCRVRAAGVVVELDEEALALVRTDAALADLEDELARRVREAGYAWDGGFQPYRTGSAFLRGDAAPAEEETDEPA